MNGGMYSVTTSQAALNALCTFEVFCWFCVGECIGKGSLIGYNVWSSTTNVNYSIYYSGSLILRYPSPLN